MFSPTHLNILMLSLSFIYLVNLKKMCLDFFFIMTYVLKLQLRKKENDGK